MTNEPQIPDWAAPLVTRARNAIIEKPGDIDCVAVVAAVLEGLGEVKLPTNITDTFDYEEEADQYGTISLVLAEELRAAQ